LWIVVTILSAIAVAVAIRRLLILSSPGAGNVPELARLDDFFAHKQALPRVHVSMGLTFVLALPLQLSATIRARHPNLHRRVGRSLVVLGMLIGITAYGMVAVPVGGIVEMSATIFYATGFVMALSIAWWNIRRRDLVRHREWMLRAIAILLGIATTRPVMGVFFATQRITGLRPSQFFGVAFWIGFSVTLLAAEWYIRSTRGIALSSR